MDLPPHPRETETAADLPKQEGFPLGIAAVLAVLTLLLVVLFLVVEPRLRSPEMKAPPGWKTVSQTDLAPSFPQARSYSVGEELGDVQIKGFAQPVKTQHGPKQGSMFLYSDAEGQELLTIFTSVQAPNYTTVLESARSCAQPSGCREKRRNAIETTLGPAYVFRPKKGDWMINIALANESESNTTLTVAAFNSDLEPKAVLSKLREYKSQ